MLVTQPAAMLPPPMEPASPPPATGHHDGPLPAAGAQVRLVVSDWLHTVAHF
jgi:hypothetical protein